jgi:hypothetical protein
MEQKISRKFNNIYSNIWIADSSLVQSDTVSLGERVPDLFEAFLPTNALFSKT